MGALAALLLAALSARLLRHRRVALATGIAAALHPGLISLSAEGPNEPLFLLLLVLAGYLLLAAADRPSSNLAVGAGVVLAAAALVRPSALFLAPLLAAPLFDRRYPRRARAHLTASGLLGLLFALAPWILREIFVFRGLEPLHEATGHVLPWNGWPQGSLVFSSPGARRASGLVEALLVIFAVNGLAGAARTGVRNFALAYLLVTAASQALLAVAWRHLLACWDPVLLLYAVPGASWLARRRRAA